MRIGLGPVFAFEWLTTSRKKQVYALRSAFGLGLLAILAMVAYSNSRQQYYYGAAPPSSIRQQAEAGRAFSAAIIATQLSLILLAAPAATAGAICLDKQRGTLTHLLMTDLTDAEIVLGKLAARLIPAIGLVLSTLGITSLSTLMGGVDPMALGGAFLVTLGVAILAGTLALCFSVWAGKTHEVIMATYLVLLVWIGFSPGWWMVHMMIPGHVSEPPGFLLKLNPYGIIVSAPPGAVPIHEHLLFFLGCLVVSAGLAALATRKVRRVATHQGDGPRKKRVRKRRRLHLPFYGPTLDGNPVAWREWHRRRPSIWTRVIWMVYVSSAVVALGFGLFLIWQNSRNSEEGAMIFVNGFGVSLGLLLMSVSSATALAEERVRGSLDVLLATPLNTRSIVWGKWWGTFRGVPWLALLPATMCAAAVLNNAWHGKSVMDDGMRWISPFLMFGLTLSYGATLTSLGLALATWMKRLGRAVGTTVTLYVLMTVGWLFTAMLVIRPGGGPGQEFVGLGLASASPWMGLAYTSSMILGDNDHQIRAWKHQLPWATFWMLAYFSVAAILYLLTLATFNRCLGRMPAEDSEDDAGPATKPETAQEGVGLASSVA